MDFVEIKIHCSEEFKEILIAETASIGCNSIEETHSGINVYFDEEDYHEIDIYDLQKKYAASNPFTFKTQKIRKINWNKEWESHFDPVLIADKCLIRASFHSISVPAAPLEIIINPKMSFGTGHHETTTLMVSSQMELNHKEKTVLDCGCGTGILSILASKLGAKKITGIDIDAWAIENSIENAKENKVEGIEFLQKRVSEISSSEFDIVLANINKNVLMEEMEIYSTKLAGNGLLLLSGFYETDLPEIVKIGSKLGLKKMHMRSENNWISVLLNKI